ncbi:hypothetical protein [Rufibacter roseus]|uniref:Uncharacterized protein n=1 Tax=Rufibacter roseus TaxID=1567108 RepID=A0ABW2DHR4_9BACT|nr:hypothetical protein [Rufibacter roseus]
MHKTYTIPKVLRTWVLLFSVPLYVGGASLWMKEEIKMVLTEKDRGQVILSIKAHEQKPFAVETLRNQMVYMP